MRFLGAAFNVGCFRAANCALKIFRTCSSIRPGVDFRSASGCRCRHPWPGQPGQTITSYQRIPARYPQLPCALLSPSSYALLAFKGYIVCCCSTVTRETAKHQPDRSEQVSGGYPLVRPAIHGGIKGGSHDPGVLISRRAGTDVDIGMASSSSKKFAAWKYAKLVESEDAENAPGSSDRY